MTDAPVVATAVRDWSSLLDEMESDATAVLEALGCDAAPPPLRWAPPTAMGPVPPALRDRARRVLALVQQAERATAAVRADVAQQLSALGPARKGFGPVVRSNSTVHWDV